MSKPCTPPKILITGVNGQVGFELMRSLAPVGTLIPASREQLDLNDAKAITAWLDRVQPDIIVNPAAYTAVDKAESDIEAAQAINVHAPAAFAQWAKAHDALLVHYSTDYVFDGTKTSAYLEDDTINPQSIYGRTKQEGEAAIRAHAPHHVILRTSWVYGAYGNNFLKTILRLARERDALSIVNDQVGSPTSAALIADVTAHIIQDYWTNKPLFQQTKVGTYHLTAKGETHWHGYAQYVTALAEQAGIALKTASAQIKGIPSSDYPTPAKRPLNSRMDTNKLEQQFNLDLPTWQEGVSHAFALIHNNQK